MKKICSACRQLAGAISNAMVVASILTAVQANAASVFRDPLDFPAEMRSRTATRPLMNITKAGARLVAVGSRGMIIYSDDSGKNWMQSRVPVQSDLLAVHFPTPRKGWAVGHDGVILHSEDSGATWQKQFDGRMASKSFAAFYRDSPPSSETAAKALDQLGQNFKAGPALPYLDVWFDDELHGFAVGSFGMLTVTADGGKTWTPWLDRIENDQQLNLNGVRTIGDQTFIVGERGSVFILDRATQRFNHVATGYAGSLFGITGNDRIVLTYGLRGAAYRSVDYGKTWQAIKMPADATITSATTLPDGGFVLTNSAGQLLLGDRDANTFQLLRLAHPARFTGIASAQDGSVALTATTGILSESLRAKR